MVGAGIVITSIRDFPPTIWGKLSTVVQIARCLILLWPAVRWHGANRLFQRQCAVFSGDGLERSTLRVAGLVLLRVIDRRFDARLALALV